MKKFLIVLIITILAASVIILTIFMLNRKVQAPESGNKQHQSIEGAATVEQVKPSLEITDMLLPAPSYKTRADNPYTHIMIHFASNAVADPANPYDLNAIYNIFKQEEIGAHYYIDREGKIYRFIDEKYNAYHAGSQAGSLPGYPELGSAGNDYSLGIELAGIGSREEMLIYGIDGAKYDLIPREHVGFTDQQYASLKQLLDDIVGRHSIAYDRQHIIGHDEYVPERRTDPGQLFDWSQIGLAD